MKKSFSTLLLILILALFGANGQVFNVNDPIIDYDEQNPPAKPPSNVVAKWVRTPGVSWNTQKWKSYIINGMAFRLRFPNNYDPNRAEEYPMVVILHGLGFQNGDKYMNERHLNNSGAKAYEDGINSGKFDGFVLSPQSDGGWFNTNHVNNINRIIDQADLDLNLDIDRVSVNGRSGGAQSVWIFMQAAPKTYAAAAPMAGVKNSSTDNIDAYKHMPLWIFQGELDDGPSPYTTEGIIDQIVAKNGNVRYTKYKNSGHGIFNKGYAEPDYFDFYSNVHKANPAVLYGEYANVFEDNRKWEYKFLEKNELCAEDDIEVRLGLTAGYDGYEWRKDGQLIAGANSNEYVATSYGVYDARFKRGDIWSSWSPEPVEVKLKDPTSTPDIQLVENVSRYIPSLDGATSVQLELPQGFATYEWRTDADNAIVGNDRVFEAITPGDYKALVVENFGCSSEVSNLFSVKNANGTNGPESPLALNGVAISKTEIKLVWSLDLADSNPATELEVFRSSFNSGPFEFIDAVDAESLEFIDNNLDPNNTYYYQVRTVNENAASSALASEGITTLVDENAPTTPTNLAMEAVNSYSVSLSWQESTDDVEVYRYDIYRDGVKVTSIDTTAATVFNLQSNKIYKFRVKARDLTGNESAFSNRVVAVTSINNESITTLKFEGDLVDMSGNNISSSISGQPSFSSDQQVEGSSSLQLNGNGFIDLDRNNVYIHDAFDERSIAFWIKQTISTGIQDVFDEGGSGNGVAFRVNQGTLEFAVRNGGTQRTLSGPLTLNEWTHVAGVFNKGVAKLYVNGIAVDVNSELPFSRIDGHGNGAGVGGTNSSNAFGQTSAGLIGFMDDFYMFRNALSESAIQDLMDVSVAVSIPDEEIFPPENVTATALSYESIRLNWDDVSNNEIQFQLYRAKKGEQMQAIAILPANSTSYMDDGLEPSTKYSYQIEALTEYNGAKSAQSTIPSLARLKFEDNLTDESGNDIDVRNNGDISYVNDNIQGSKAISFDGSSILNLDNGNQFIHTAFTERSVSFWYKSLDVSGTQDIYDEGGSTNGFAIRLVDSDLQLTTQNGHAIFSVQAPVSRNEWHHVMGVYQEGALRLYIDGTLVASRSDLTYTTVNTHGDAGGLGGTNGSNAFDQNSNNFTGYIDDFYAFDQAMDDQIQDIIASANPGSVATTYSLPNPPVAVSDLSIDELGLDYVTLSFNDNSNDETHFEISRAINSANNYQQLAILDSQNGGDVSYTDSNLDPHVEYFYQVIAVNAGGSSNAETVSGTTLNTIPELSDISESLTIHYASEYDVNIYGSDGDGDQLSIIGANLPSFANLVDYGDGSGLLRFSPSAADTVNSPYNDIIIILSDAFGGESSDTLDLVVNNNHLPELTTVDDILLAEGASGLISVVASDEEGTSNLSWSYELPSFVAVAINIDGTAEISLTPGYADHGIYPSSVSVTDLDGATTTESFTITVTDKDPNEEVLVNFYQNTTASSGWNNIGGLGSHSLTTTTGDASGVTVEMQTSSWKVYNQGAQSGSDNGIFPDAVLKDYYYFGIFGAPETVTMKLSGLNPNSTYDYSFVGSSTWNGVADNGSTVYTIGGESATVDVQYNTQNAAEIRGVQPNAAGEVYVVLSKSAGTSVGYLNGFSMRSIYGSDELPAAPRSLEASLSGSSVLLNWIDAPYNETGFRVYRSETSGGSYTELASLPVGTEAYEDAAIEEGVTYYYVVTAYNANGESAYSEEISFTPPNTPPSITVNGSTALYVNQSGSLEVEISDSPSNTVTPNVSGMPSFGSYSTSATGVTMSFLPGMSDIGSYTIIVSASDNLGASSQEEIELTVSEEVLYEVSVNFNNTSNALSPWNNTSKAPAQGDVFANLIDEEGANSGLSLSLETAFGGVYNEGATTGDNSGVVPDNVLREYYYWGIFGAPEVVEMKVSGLDYNNKYSISFVASSTFRGSGVTDNGETVYTIGNKSVSLDVESNTDRMVSIEGVTANASGEISISMSKGNGARVGYINGMVITAYAGDPSIFDPSDLTAQALDGNSIGLQWSDNSFDETGFEVYRSATKTGSYSLIATVGADETDYVDTGLSTGSIYYYKVRADYGTGSYSSYTETVASGTISHYVYVNINGVPQYDADVPWNNLSVESVSGDVFIGFMNQNGDPTGMALEVINGMQGSNDWGATTGNDSGVYPDDVMKSFYFSDRLEEPGKFKLIGLDGSYSYNLKFFGSIVTSYDIVTNFSSQGQTVANNQTNNISEVSGLYGLEANSDGEIEFTVQEASNSTWAIFNAFVLEAYPKESEDIFARNSLATNNSRGVVGDYEVRFGKANPIVTYYPNPAKEFLRIRIEGAPTADAKITMLDLTGRKIFDKTQFLNTVNSEITIENELQGLQYGMYLISVEIAGERFIERVVIR